VSVPHISFTSPCTKQPLFSATTRRMAPGSSFGPWASPRLLPQRSRPQLQTSRRLLLWPPQTILRPSPWRQPELRALSAPPVAAKAMRSV
jgi:hypothetical protein